MFLSWSSCPLFYTNLKLVLSPTLPKLTSLPQQTSTILIHNARRPSSDPDPTLQPPLEPQWLFQTQRIRHDRLLMRRIRPAIRASVLGEQEDKARRYMADKVRMSSSLSPYLHACLHIRSGRRSRCNSSLAAEHVGTVLCRWTYT